MKCMTCGAEIRLSDKVCPHCGRELKETEGHRKEKKKYKIDSENTKQKAAGIIGTNIPIVMAVIMMILLLIGVGVVYYVREEAYHFTLDAARKDSVKNAEEYKREIRNYLDKGDYTGFAAFKSCHAIAEWEEPYEDLNVLSEVTQYYSRLVSSVEVSVMYGPNAKREPGDDARQLQRDIDDFYYQYEHMLEDIDADLYKDYMHDMKDKADTVLEVYLGLDESGREKYFSEDEFSQRAYLEEVLGNE